MRSAQAYEIVPANAGMIVEILNGLQDASRYPKTLSIETEGRTTTAHIRVNTNDGALDCHLRLLAGNGRLDAVGPNDARQAARMILNQNEKVVKIHELSKKFVVYDTLANLRKQDKRNFIKKLDVEFDSDGIKYHNRVHLHKMSYELVEETCASTHQAFDTFMDGALSVKVKFGIRSLLDIIDNSASKKAASLNMGMDSTISVYSDHEPQDLFRILDYLVGGSHG